MEKIEIFVLENDFLKVELLNLGAVIKKIELKDKHGILRNVVLGFEDIEKYRENPAYFGAVIGRTAGRIEKGLLKIEDKTYKLDINNGENTLHGGKNSISHKFWNVEKIENGFRFLILSKSFDNGYPADADIKVEYILDKNELLIKYFASSNEKSYINLTNHTYFNLSGDKNKNIYEDELKLNSNFLIGINKNSIPCETLNLENTIFDFRNSKKINNFFGEEKNSKFLEQRSLANEGIDHPFVFDKENKTLELKNFSTGIDLKVETDNPAVVIYTGNYLQEIGFNKHSAICFETQEVPNLYEDKKLNLEPSFINKDFPYKRFTKFIFQVKKAR